MFKNGRIRSHNNFEVTRGRILLVLHGCSSHLSGVKRVGCGRGWYFNTYSNPGPEQSVQLSSPRSSPADLWVAVGKRASQSYRP